MAPRRFSLRRPARIIRPEDFRRTFTGGRRHNSRYFTFYVHESPTSHARLGLAVGKRYFRHAVARNRLKRVIRESFRRHAPSLPARDYVVVARAPAGRAPARDLFVCLDGFFTAAAGGPSST